jgi:Zn-dependent protease with chaperone function
MAGGAATEANREQAAELLEPLQKPVPPVRIPWSYTAAAWLSAAVVALILAGYVALMAACLWFTLDYLVAHGRLLFQGARQGSAVGYLFLGLGVLGVLILLVKPVLHASPSSLAPTLLRPDQQPLFFEYLRDLCKALGTPIPARVRVDLSTNASASVRRPWRRAFRAELEMTLGLPLLAAMEVREISSIMAHELGHFTRPRMGQVLAIIHAANHWFARAVYERDRFDLWLDVHCAGGSWIVRLPALFARLFLRVGRGILWVFMALGRLGTCMVSRADEYNSDRYAVRLCGAEAHVNALQKTSSLSVVLGVALSEARQSWEDKRLPDDLPRMVAARAERLDRAQRSEILTAMGKERTGWFSTHPCLADRIQAARSSESSPPVRSSRPAADLIEDFPTVCRKATVAFYRGVLGGEFKPSALVPSDSILKEHADLFESRKALARYYQGGVLVIRPIYPGPEAARAPEDSGRAREDLLAGRELALDNARDLQDLMGEYASNDAALFQLFLVRHLTAAGVGLDPRPELGLHSMDRATIQRREEALQARAGEVVFAMSPFEENVRTRMTRALQLARSPEQGVDLASVDRLLATAAALERAQSTVRDTAWNLRVLLMLMRIDFENGHVLALAVDRHGRELCGNLTALQETLQQVPYPFEHGKAGATLSGYLFDKPVIGSAPSAVAAVAMTALERIDLLIWRVLSQLALIAEKVETALGLAPPAEPPEEIAAESWIEPRVPFHNHPALQAPVAALVLGLMVALGYGVTEALPRFSVLPKHDQYRPVIVSARWTPPPREDVWRNGFQPYRPVENPKPAHFSDASAAPNAPQVDPWGRLVITDSFGRRHVQDSTGRRRPYDPVPNPSGVRMDAFGRPYVPNPMEHRTGPFGGHDPLRDHPGRRSPGSDPFGPRDPRPSAPQPGGFGPSPPSPRSPFR